MARTLATTVYVTNPETGTSEGFAAGTTPPDWAAELITNPSAWDDQDITGNEAVRRVAIESEPGRITVTQTKPLDEMTKAELVDEANKRDVDSSGTKADLLKRLQES
jgi:hypothetical protein